MSLPPVLVDEVANALCRVLESATTGHCLRVDHLSTEGARSVCRRLNQLTPEDVLVAVLGNASASDDIQILPEEAIEIRDRKEGRFCLLVPTGFADAAASSLQNSFSEFDLQNCLRQVVVDLRDRLPDEIRPLVEAAIHEARRRRPPAAEHQAEYVAAVLEDPRPETAGFELWRLGLVPDAGGADFTDRLQRNHASVDALAHPARTHTTARERLASLSLGEGPVRDDLRAFFADRRMREARAWLQDLAKPENHGVLTFEAWPLPPPVESDLTAIDVQPLLDKNGVVEGYTKLWQAEGPGSALHAEIGAKKRVTIKWKTEPGKPTDVQRWKAELVPSTHEYAEGSVEGGLPEATGSRTARTINITMDIDLEQVDVRAVQVRIIAIDEHGSPIEHDGQVVEGFSDEFWLSDEEAPPPPPGDPRSTRSVTVPNLPITRLRAVADRGDPVEETPGSWREERDLDTYQFSLGGRHGGKVGLAPFLKSLEQRRLGEPASPGTYRMVIDANDVAEIGDVESLADQRDSDAALRLAERRRKLFQAILAQQARGVIEVAEWTEDLQRMVRSYATAYRDGLDEATAGDRQALLEVDTLHLSINHAHGTETAVLVLPTHPLRMLWLGSHAALLQHWEEELVKAGTNRQQLIDLRLASRLEPLNVPPLVQRDGDSFFFLQNLRFFWGVALPIEASEPSRRLSDVARVLGLSEDEATLSDVPPERVAAELEAYHEVHPYLTTLRLNVVNPGSGAFIASTLRRFLRTALKGDQQDRENALPPRIELLAHAPEPMPPSLPQLDELQREVYENWPEGRGSHLSPLFATFLRPTRFLHELQTGEANITLLVDHFLPRIEGVQAPGGGDSSSFYGLMFQRVPEFVADDTGYAWRHHFVVGDPGNRERHPADGRFTTELLNSHRSYLNAFLDHSGLSQGGGSTLALTAAVDPEARVELDALHDKSDWVITLDRFLGADFFDSPQDPDLSRVARTYLLDYMPEFLDGLGHRMLVTTSHREEVEEVLTRAMTDLGFGLVEESVGEVLHHLKTISGRLALRVMGDDARAREAVSLGVVAAYLKAKGELSNCILVPVDAHPELFGTAASHRANSKPRLRCDLIKIEFQHGALVATFIEVKSRGAAAQPEELLQRIADQIEETESVFRSLFFSEEPRRLDHDLQRSRLANILGFYLERAWRHGLIEDGDALQDLRNSIRLLEGGVPNLKSEHRGFVVNLQADPQEATSVRDATIKLITAADLSQAGVALSSVHRPPAVSAPDAGADQAPTPASSVPGSGAPPESVPPEVAEPEMSADSGTDFGQESVDTEAKQAASGTRTWDEEWSRRQGSEPEPDRPVVGRGSAHERNAARPDASAEDISPGEASDTDEPAVELGRSDVDQEPVIWKPRVQGSPHLFILGIPGQGKSVTVTRGMRSLALSGVPSVILDFHGQFAGAGSDGGPVVLDIGQGLPFSPFEADPGNAGASAWMGNAFAVAEIFEYVCGLGDIQRDVVYEAIRDAYKANGFGASDTPTLPTIGQVRDLIEQAESERGVRNVTARTRPLLEFGLFREQQPETEFADLLSQGLVIDVSKAMHETLQLAAGAFVLRKIYKDMFKWGESDRLRLAIVLDEAHRLAKDISLPKIMKEGRKFGISVIAASQNLEDFHQYVIENAGSKIVFRTNPPASRKVASQLAGPKGLDLVGAIEQLDVGQAIVQLEGMASARRVRMHGPGEVIG